MLGKMKNETDSTVITEVAALSPKIYGYRYIDKSGTEKETKRAKGDCRATSKKSVAVSDYKRAMMTGNIQTRAIYGVRPFNQLLFSGGQDSSEKFLRQVQDDRRGEYEAAWL